ncbi:SMP-30/gluconolactonase/LRE family protein [Echinimonas agarilytica]|uniref:SMP-30/gluconolactonase/LRE family protein n=1 Tax=Echinimonas agarilytica TaxID=1215918 RepID=A0AA41W7T4_9GAMM|nr:SMP-30/gluconolactonase/LRE family protein [Echinimonas agarilytica]MCM2679919.1 SMP-30/gluconolactonase/LRE family protein [Echinimonas agarilytica]
MLIKSISSTLLCVFLIACSATQMPTSDKIQDVNAASPLRIEIYDASLNAILDDSIEPEVVASGFTWSEGPVWVESEQKVLFSDVPRNLVLSWSEHEGLQEYLNPAGATGLLPNASHEGSNGLALNAEGQLVLAQHGDRRVSKLRSSMANPKPSYETLADNFQGKKFNSPNDLHIQKDGTIWFTDPPYGLPQGPLDKVNRELDFNGVFRISKERVVTLVSTELSYPNGIAMSNDESVLYVANSDPKHAVWMAWPIDENRMLGEGKILFDATHMVADGNGLPDGLKIHPTGVLFATGPDGVLLLSPEGKLLGQILTGQPTGNLAFNNDFSTLYITANNRLVRIKMK